MTAEDHLKHALVSILENMGKAAGKAKAQAMRDSVRERIPSAKDLQAGSLLNAFQATMFDVVDEAEGEDDALFERLDDLLDLSLYCTEQELQDQNVPFCLIEDLLDILTISGAERVIAYMETRVARLTANINPKRGKGLTLLRLCNEILRRLSRTKHTITSGRLLIFMASVFPLCEQSGVNLRGTFNLINETHYEGEEMENAMDTDEPGKDTPEALYRIFWHLQKFFVNPTLLWVPEEFNIFQKGITTTLTRFEQINKELTPSSSRHSTDDRKRKQRSDNANGKDASASTRSGSDSQNFFPKYLTNPNLFELELRDPFFRRQIMAQFSIILQYMLMLGKDEKEKVANDLADYPDRNKSVQYPYTLTPEQEIWLKEARARSYTISESTYPYGKLFARNLSTVVTHERNWIDWKNRSCKSFELPFIEVEAGAQKPKLLGSDTVRRSNWLGNDQLTSLWARGDQAEALMRSPSRKKAIPDLESLVEQLEEQLDEEGNLTGGVEEEYALHKDMRFNWRTYRTAMRHHLSLFHSARQVEIQIDSKAPAKTLLMEWRKEQRRKESISAGNREEKDSTQDANETAVKQDPMDTPGTSRQNTPEPQVQPQLKNEIKDKGGPSDDKDGQVPEPCDTIPSPSRKRSADDAADADEGTHTPTKRPRISQEDAPVEIDTPVVEENGAEEPPLKSPSSPSPPSPPREHHSPRVADSPPQPDESVESPNPA
ncbi:THO complex subunit 1 transcription elongation factor-domain-containing protein [Phlyctochytrium arcticum]|nr:THO complex subunit 1 transcription elongation factor-domain-containing protein [Phlyctochytrium arcticum]